MESICRKCVSSESEPETRDSIFVQPFYTWLHFLLSQLGPEVAGNGKKCDNVWWRNKENLLGNSFLLESDKVEWRENKVEDPTVSLAAGFLCNFSIKRVTHKTWRIKNLLAGKIPKNPLFREKVVGKKNQHLYKKKLFRLAHFIFKFIV